MAPALGMTLTSAFAASDAGSHKIAQAARPRAVAKTDQNAREASNACVAKNLVCGKINARILVLVAPSGLPGCGGSR